MAKYLRTSGISASLEELIRDSKVKLYIISPYLKLSDSIKELFNDKEREKVEVRIIFGKQELNPGEMSYLEGLRYVRLYFSKNLHAKCYLNETKMIITSMNLWEFSQQNNKEMGILIDRTSESDSQVYDDAWKDIESIVYNAEDFSYIKAPSERKVERPAREEGKKANLSNGRIDLKGRNTSGYCIRTGVEIPFNLEKPFCYEAYKVWSKKENRKNPEKYCHFTGEISNGETSYEKPILKKNWKKADDVHNLNPKKSLPF
jgi:phosphatidylserine/phosphatidylglycerophosphate/cardiolipin synthase-like enzyme